MTATERVILAAKGVMVLRPQYKPNTNRWHVAYFTKTAGWARLNHMVDFKTKELAEAEMNRLVEACPDKYRRED